MFRCSPLFRLRNLVSMKLAPSFSLLPEKDAIGKSVRDIPPRCFTGYVTPEVITPEEEKSLLNYTATLFDRLPFNDGHMDGLIHHYKEFYRSYANIVKELDPAALSGLQKARSLADHYLPHIPVDDRVHFLQLEAEGFIRAHVDENRNSTGLIGGLCLGAGRIMTMTHPKHPGEKIELLLAPRCFYAMIGTARYDWEHSVDWTEDDAEHLKRIQKKSDGSGIGKPIIFDGEETEYVSGTRTAIIFRGISPLHLLQQRTGQTL